MKTKRFFIATLLVVAATSIAVVSCKKETPNALLNNTPQSVKVFSPPQVDDMKAYLKDFKQKMKSATRDMNETLSLEEAAWHLASVANYDFGNINVEFDEMRFDTIYSNVNVTDGTVLLNDLGLTYERISTDIEEFYNGLCHDNCHFRFINTSITMDGHVTVSLITTFCNSSRYWGDTTWYFQNQNYADSLCFVYFNPNGSYPANGYGMAELQRVLNLVATKPVLAPNGQAFFTPSTTKHFYFLDYIDSFGSPNYKNSRLFCTNGYFSEDLVNDMCYYLDSYAGLAKQHCSINEAIIGFCLSFEQTPMPYQHLRTGYHSLTVQYGLPVGQGGETPGS